MIPRALAGGLHRLHLTREGFRPVGGGVPVDVAVDRLQGRLGPRPLEPVVPVVHAVAGHESPNRPKSSPDAAK
jgi:hypothetical protein